MRALSYRRWLENSSFITNHGTKGLKTTRERMATCTLVLCLAFLCRSCCIWSLLLPYFPPGHTGMSNTIYNEKENYCSDVHFTSSNGYQGIKPLASSLATPVGRDTQTRSWNSTAAPVGNSHTDVSGDSMVIRLIAISAGLHKPEGLPVHRRLHRNTQVPHSCPLYSRTSPVSLQNQFRYNL